MIHIYIYIYIYISPGTGNVYQAPLKCAMSDGSQPKCLLSA